MRVWSTAVAKLFLLCFAASQWSLSVAVDDTTQKNEYHQFTGVDGGNRERQLRGVPMPRASSQFSSSDRHSAVETSRSSQIETINIASEIERENANSNNLSSESAEFSSRLPTQDEIIVCQQMTLDFAKASNGRAMWGGEFIRGEWFHRFGLSIDAQGHDGRKNLHPMIFDSADVESNGLGGDDAFALGSPNFDCEGFGVGIGGKIGRAGENCKALGNLLIPSQKPGTPSASTSSSHPLANGGVLIFEFHKLTNVENIGLLNIGNSDQIMVVSSDGNLEKIDLHSVGQNGFQKINLDRNGVKKMYVSLRSFGAVSGLDLCVAAN